jgi:hypothetical protein
MHALRMGAALWSLCAAPASCRCPVPLRASASQHGECSSSSSFVFIVFRVLAAVAATRHLTAAALPIALSHCCSLLLLPSRSTVVLLLAHPILQPW